MTADACPASAAACNAVQPCWFVARSRDSAPVPAEVHTTGRRPKRISAHHCAGDVHLGWSCAVQAADSNSWHAATRPRAAAR